MSGDLHYLDPEASITAGAPCGAGTAPGDGTHFVEEAARVTCDACIQAMAQR